MGGMSDTVQQIKERLSIVDVVSQYVKLERSGATVRARCPFHGERTPSFHVSLDRGTYHCFGCGVGGDIFSFVQAIEGVDFKGALKILAERAGVQLVYGKDEKKDERGRLFELLDATTHFYSTHLTPEAKEYLTKRGLEEGTIMAFRLGYAGNAWSECADYLKSKGFSEKEIIDAGVGRANDRGGVIDKFRNRIIFPIADSAGRVVGFSGRIFGEHASPDAPKYLNSPETPLFHKSHVLYGMDRAKASMRTHNFGILVEGQMDLLMSHQAGWTNTVAVSGTALTAEQSLLIKRMTDNLVIALDADMAGIKAAGRGARAALASGLSVKVASMPEGMDPADLILKEGSEAWRTVIKNASDVITFLLDTLERHIPQKNRFYIAVAQVVLPFVKEVQSPTARHRYVVEVAKKLGATERAVEEEIARLPASESDASPTSPHAKEAFSGGKETDALVRRAKNIYAVIAWQAASAKPLFDTKEHTKKLTEIVGEAMMQEFAALPESDQEVLRFKAEAANKADKLEKDIIQMENQLEREKLSHDLTQATSELKKAEAAGRDDVAAELTMQCQLLTARIAKLHNSV